MIHSIRLDLGHFSTAQSLHEALAAALGFPDYYGMNWDAFDECISDHNVLWPGETELVLYRLEILEERLPREAKLLCDCLYDGAKSRPGFSYRFEQGSPNDAAT